MYQGRSGSPQERSRGFIKVFSGATTWLHHSHPRPPPERPRGLTKTTQDLLRNTLEDHFRTSPGAATWTFQDLPGAIATIQDHSQGRSTPSKITPRRSTPSKTTPRRSTPSKTTLRRSALFTITYRESTPSMTSSEPRAWTFREDFSKTVREDLLCGNLRG